MAKIAISVVRRMGLSLVRLGAAGLNAGTGPGDGCCGRGQRDATGQSSACTSHQRKALFHGARSARCPSCAGRGGGSRVVSSFVQEEGSTRRLCCPLSW